MDETEIQSFLIISSVVVLVISFTMISLFLLFRKKKNDLILEKRLAEQKFEQEIAKAQIEIREETFRNISWELHDNIGQLLTLAKIQLANNLPKDEVKETISKSISELRTLSKLINPETLKNIDLKQALQDETNRFNRLNFINANLEIKGNIISLDHKTEIVFFRILQEFFSNTIKHAKASHLCVTLNYLSSELIITAKDNGLGFNTYKTNNSGIGLSNIKSRANLVKATAKIESEINKGTKLTIIYPYVNGIT
ncbi:sensor histidine kinase [Neotamlana laminarinivorans]|uniref:histidine kinase n=1 Tax=Neotamlana laminarinivorans TaxID=2883124 RepID=A0A9X1HZM7_9FLAO|nr:ATP-binding protein [Tamlana laminarinivorans]MCB4797304.1 histidine kinase [Tamlana laminarinivorans]